MDEHRFFRARKTLKAMLHTRGFEIPLELQNETESSFHTLYVNGELPDIFARRSSDGERIGVGFAADDGASTVRVVPVRQFALRLKDEAISRGILVLCNKLTSFAAREVRDLPHRAAAAVSEEGGGEDADMDAEQPRIECFTLAKLYHNIMDYQLQPKFTLLTPKQVADLNVQPRHFLHMLCTDPVAQFMGLDPGHVLRIVRRHPIAGYEVVHRIVVDQQQAVSGLN